MSAHTARHQPPGTGRERDGGVRRVMLVTGASSGIGRATVCELARHEPATIVLVGRRDGALHETVERAQETAHPEATFDVCPWDLTDRLAIDSLVHDLRTRYGRLDVLVNNAGTGSDLDITESGAMDHADRMIALNFRAPIALTIALLPLLEHTRGTIINVSSVAGLVGTPDSAVYSATKWGLTGFSEALRARVSTLGICVVCVHPGPVPTPGWPHAELMRRPVARRLLTCTPDVIARTIARAARGKGGVNPVRPRIYAATPLLRTTTPWLVRAALVASVRAGLKSAATGLREQRERVS